MCPVALTIAGSDSSGGAGIQADLKTFTVLGVYGMSAITAITAQNTTEVADVHVLPVAAVAAQIDAVMGDIGCDAAKTGMLATAKIVEIVADAVKRWDISRLVIDPVMVSKTGHKLLADDACEVLKRRLLPLAAVVTPNLPEAETLAGRAISDEEDMIAAARELCRSGCQAVVIKGGHRPGDCNDYLYERDSGSLRVLAGERVQTSSTHGTGCTFSAALAACLALGMSVAESAWVAKEFVTAAIAGALPLGFGHGPTNHIAAGETLRAKLRETGSADDTRA